MKIINLKLKNYRNCKEIKLDLNNGFVFKEAIIGSVKNNMLFINTMDIAVLRVIKI